jgi:oligopeptide transport system substrate-binding protein
VTFDFTDLSFTRAARVVANQIFEGLFRYTENGGIAPAGATGYDVSTNGLTYTIHLRPAVRWSDGEFVVAQHFVDGLLRFGGTPWDFLLFPISGYEEYTVSGDPNDVEIEILDDYTFLITLDSPFAHFPHVLTTPRVSDPVRLDLSEDQRPYVNNGPYTLEDWDPNDYLALIRNDLYWNAGEVEIAQIYMPIIEDLADQLDQYAAGLLDVSSYPTEALPDILADPVLRAELREIPRPGIYYLGLNVSRPPTDSPDLRIALAASIDRQEILDNVLSLPWRDSATSVLPPEILGYQDTGAGYPFDLQVAQDHLTTYMVMNGILDPADIVVELWYNTAHQFILENLADMWETNLGVSVNAVDWDWTSYLSELRYCQDYPADPNCTYNSYRLGWIADYWDPWNILNDLFGPESGRNYTHWDSPTYRALMAAAALETDEAVRLDLFQQAEAILVEEDVAIIPIFFYDETLLVKSNINFEFPIDGSAPYLIDWSLYQNSTYVVESSADPGEPGDLILTLHEALEAANANPGTDVIAFDIPVGTDPGCDAGTGVCTIRPLAALPTIQDPVIVDGYTQPGATPNTNPPGLGNNAALKIELDGSLAGEVFGALFINAGDSQVRGLVINRFDGHGIVLESASASGNRIEGNFIGTDHSGESSLGNSGHGVEIINAPGTKIQENIIAYNGGDGIRVAGGTALGNQITKNAIHGNVGKGIWTLEGGNAELKPPIITAMLGDQIHGDALPGNQVEIFADMNGEGAIYLDTVTADPITGNFTYSGNLEGPNLTATATDLSGNTSEFSIAVAWRPDSCELNSTFDTACDVAARLGFSLGGSGTFSSYLSHREDLDWFFFDLPASVSPGSQITFNLSGLGGGELPANFDLLVLGEMEVDPTTGASPLQGVPLQGVPLQGVPLQGVPLQGVDAEAVPLQGVPLQGVDVHDIPLQGVPLQGVPLQGVPLQGVPLQGVPLQGVGFHAGGIPEEVVTLFRGGMTGRYYIMVWSSSGEYSTSVTNSPYEVGITVEGLALDTCTTGLNRDLLGTPLTSPLGNTTNPKTLILLHQPRMSALYGDQETQDLVSALAEELAPHPLVDGVLVDLGNPTHYVDDALFQQLEERYANWDEQGCDPESANLISLPIKQILLNVLNAYEGSIENLVLIGGDKVIPFRRVPDEVIRTPDGATVPNEYDYQSEVDGIKKIGGVGIQNRPAYATLRLMYYLSDDFYADMAPILLEHGHELSVPDMPIGRVVENPRDIMAQITEYLTRDGLMGEVGTPPTGLTSGYSFLVDQALEVDAVFSSKGFDPHHTLISDIWGRVELMEAYVGQLSPPLINALNGHFDHWRIAPADLQTPEDLISTEDVLSSSADFGGTLLFSVGCHLGFSLPDEDALNDPEPGALDFPQVLLAQGGTVVGNTGFGYGDDAALAYSEELMLGMARFLGGGNLGQALVDAKRDYLLNQALLDPIHEKILMQVVFYGLPMWEFDAPVPSIPDGISSTSSTSTIDGLTVETYEIQVDTGHRSEVTIPELGSYFSLAGRTQAALFRPIQPQAGVDASGVPGEVAHGALFIGGTYVDITDFDPVITMPSWTRGNPEPQFNYEGWDPLRFWSLAQLERGDGGLDERLVFVPGQFLIDESVTLSTGVTHGTERLYNSLDFQIIYAPDSVEFQAPIINRIVSSVLPTQVVFFQVHVEDPPDPDGLTSEILRVLITYSLADGGTVWESEELSYNPESGAWEGFLTPVGPINFFVQALDGSGNVGMFAGNGYFTPVPMSVQGPALALVGQSVSFSATHSLTNPAILWDFDDGSQSAGEESVFHAFNQPGQYLVTARVVSTKGDIGQASIPVEVILDPNTAEETMEQALSNLVLYIGDAETLPNNAIKKKAKNRRKTLINKLEALEELIEQKDYEEAIAKIEHDIHAKMDGCPPIPDKNDWIISCEHQGIMGVMLDDLVVALESLAWSVSP